MKRTKHFYRVWLNFKVNLQKVSIKYKKAVFQLWTRSKPYLKARYGIIYLLSFCLGLYLFGPSHGLQNINILLLRQHSEKKVNSIEALQKEIELLKKDIQGIQHKTKKNIAEFNPGVFTLPAQGEVINKFDWINKGNIWKLNDGIDISVLPGTKVVAAADGVVSDIQKTVDGSFSIRLQHGEEWESIYSNLSRIFIEKGQRVASGIALGASGINNCYGEEPGFHFGIYHNGQPVNPEKVVKGF